MKKLSALLAAASLTLCFAVGCGEGETSSPPITPAADATPAATEGGDAKPEGGAAAPLSVSEAAKVRLASADKADGKEDHVIESCYTCALAMKGKAEFTCTVDGYEAHFCSGHCCEKFEQDAETVVMATDVPEGDK